MKNNNETKEQNAITSKSSVVISLR